MPRAQFDVLSIDGQRQVVQWTLNSCYELEVKCFVQGFICRLSSLIERSLGSYIRGVCACMHSCLCYKVIHDKYLTQSSSCANWSTHLSAHTAQGAISGGIDDMIYKHTNVTVYRWSPAISSSTAHLLTMCTYGTYVKDKRLLDGKQRVQAEGLEATIW